MVEFALITPVFFLVFFGIVEFALLTASIGSFNFAGREGALVGSILGRTTPNADQSIVSAVSNHVQGVVMAKGLEVDIYKANPNNGSCLTSSGSDVAVGTSTCLEDQYQINGQPLPGGTMTWPPAARNDTLQNADYLGVRAVYQYTYLTGFVAPLGSALGLSTYSVQRIEPQDYFGWHGSGEGWTWVYVCSDGAGCVTKGEVPSTPASTVAA